MDLKGIMPSEISQAMKEKYRMISLICGSQKIQKTSEYNKKADSQMQRTNQFLPMGGGNIGLGSGRYKLLGVRQTQGCTVQHREYSQYFVITMNGQ